MTNKTVYKIDHYYESGEGSSVETFTTKDEALKGFYELVEELKDEWSDEPEVIDYAVLWSCKEDEDEEEVESENLLYWTFEHGFTDYDPPSRT